MKLTPKKIIQSLIIVAKPRGLTIEVTSDALKKLREYYILSDIELLPKKRLIIQHYDDGDNGFDTGWNFAIKKCNDVLLNKVLKRRNK